MVFLVGLIGLMLVGKICAFLGNNYDKILNIKLMHSTPPNLKEKIRREIINLIENENVDTFWVGEIGGYEIDAYDVVLDVRKEHPQIWIYLVVSKINDMHKKGVRDYRLIEKFRDFDDFILPPKCEFGYKKLCLVYRNRYIAENADFIISYNKYKGKAYEFCKIAKRRGAKVIELSTDKE